MLNVINFTGQTIGDGIRVAPENVLDGAKAQSFSEVVVMGRLDDGEIYTAGTCGAADTLMLIEQAKRILVP